MINTIVLDSGPLGLIVHQRLATNVAECRNWIARHLGAGVRVAVPASVAYELRRELLRLRHARSIALLDTFIEAEPNRFIPLSEPHLREAARMWAEIRQQGYPTADPHALDIDVILAAQALGLQLPPSNYVVATTNPAHLNLFVPARDWQAI